ncbi:hypothetical protein Lfu02_16970 [Longispora fulva]|uniref:DUF6879 domain-containing protein n=1 Tax=Longispora fulva TaxID=619741 RepID=A0A8J7KJE1_9ACTN|nr:DUF6879 family protein [Longispora fulva]MBG6140295.1 hypothetical protein [Longispora fulva]GIG57325.1 hypothetical protein Lfu02_16970 [Longispora fulva]
MASNKTLFEDLFRAARRSAVHLEMRDGYMLDDEYAAWLRGDHTFESDEGNWWFSLVKESVARGVEIRRARVVSEPISSYVRFEYELTGGHNAKAGERVRWLPRRQATGLALPGNDFWLFDGETLLINHFAGNGDATEKEIVTDPAVIVLCRSAFEAVWELAVPHEDYQPS